MILNNFGARGELLRGYGAALAVDKMTAFVLLFVFAALLGMRNATQLYNLVANYSHAMHIGSVSLVVTLLVLAAPIPACRQGGWLRILLLAALQLGFSATFLAVDRDKILGMAEGSQRVGYAFVSFFRWAVDSWLLTMVVEQACSLRLASTTSSAAATAPRGASLSSDAPPPISPLPSSALATLDVLDDSSHSTSSIVMEESSRALRPFPLYAHAGAAAAIGLAFTVPWVGENFPDDATLSLWLPYPRQSDYFAAAYAVLGLAFIGGTCAILYYARRQVGGRVADGVEEQRAGERHGSHQGQQPEGTGGGRGHDRAPRVPSPGRLSAVARFVGLSETSQQSEASLEASIGRLPGYTLRVGLLGACAAMRCVSQAAMCTFLAESAEFSAAVAQLLAIIVFFEDGQGIITFMLFGLSLLPLAAARARSLWRRCVCCAPSPEAEEVPLHYGDSYDALSLGVWAEIHP